MLNYSWWLLDASDITMMHPLHLASKNTHIHVVFVGTNSNEII